MANPQREDGHVDIANEIVEKFCTFHLSGHEWQVLWVILRKTYGWRKKEDKIALSQFRDMTGLPRDRVCRILQRLELRGVVEKYNTTPTTYSFVKDYDKWVLYKNTTSGGVVEKYNTSVVKKNNRVLYKNTTTNNTITNNNLTKDIDTNDIVINNETDKDKQHVENFFNYYIAKTKRSFKLTPMRESIIRSRLKEGRTIEELKRAVDNFVLDDWVDRHKFMDLVYCIGIRNKKDNLDAWLSAKPKSGIEAYLEKEAVNETA